MPSGSLFRTFFLSLLLITGLATSGRAAEPWEDGCLANLQNDLKRQDLAAAIGLHYYTKRPPGITRTVTERKEIRLQTNKKGVTAEKEVAVYDVAYFDPAGKKIEDAGTLARIKGLAIPPAYRDVWISTDLDSHVLAIGKDARGRPQYAYHPKWTAATSVTKFLRMREFGKQVSVMRTTVLSDLRSPGITKNRLLAGAATILETGSIRVGSEEYARANGTYGLTTLLKSHVKVDGATVSFDFIGKEHIPHKFSVENADVAALFGELLKQPGERLFRYLDRGEWRAIAAADVNVYLEGAMGAGFSAKDFRTWQGTTAAARKLMELGPPADEKDAVAKVKEAVIYASSILRNEPNTARENYISPLVLGVYAEGDGSKFTALAKRAKQARAIDGLKPEERLVLSLLGAR